MKKILNALLLSIILFLLNINLVLASDIIVTCDNSICNMSPAPLAALFDETEFPQYDLKPGDHVSRKITVTNNGDETCNFKLSSASIKEQNPSTFAQVLKTAIQDSSTEIYGSISGGIATDNKNLENLLTTDFPTLGSINSGQSKVFTWFVSFGTNIGNEYQGARLVFDFDMNFSCGNPDVTPTPTPTPGPTSTPGPISTPTTDGGGTGGPSVTPTPSPTSLLTGFVAGAQTFLNDLLPTPTPTPKIGGVEEEKILGKQTCCPKIEPSWWILLMLQVLFLTNYYLKKIRQDKKTDLIIVSCLTFLAFFISHLLLHSIFINYFKYQESKFCEFFWLLSIISILLINGSYIMIKKENK